MNSLSDTFLKGTFGELFVQLRLLQYEVQSAPPLKDTGNDLIAIKGEVFKAIQVKTTEKDDKIKFNFKKLSERKYHILALVFLDQKESDEPNAVNFDKCKIYLLKNGDVKKGTYKKNELAKFELKNTLVNSLFV